MNLAAGSSMGMEAMSANMLTGYLSTKFKIETIYFGIVYAFILEAIIYSKTNIPFITENIKGINIGDTSNYVLWIILFVFVLLLKKFVNLDYFFKKEMMTIKIYDPKEIKIFTKYMNYYSENFDKMYDTNIGDIDAMTNLINYPPHFEGIMFPTFNKEIYYNDKNIGIEGTINFGSIETTVTSNTNINGKDLQQTNKFNIKFICIMIKKSTSKITNVFEFNKKVNELVKIKEGNKIIRYAAKIYEFQDKFSEQKSILYEGERRNVDELEKIYIDSFFHKEKHRLWSYIKNLSENPESFLSMGQNPQCNLLLYGPPGSGKSSFAYRIAMSLNRHIVNMDLKSMTKQNIYQVLTTPCFKDIFYTAADVVYIFDEFDITMDFLYKKEKMKEKNKNGKKNYFHNGLIKEEIMLDLLCKKSENIVSSGIIPNTTEIQKENQKLDEKLGKESGKKDSNKKSKKKLDDYDMYGMSSTQIRDTIELRDLLEIFQGAVPQKGSIIIATTNHYEKIKEMCPALFRPGRLTPVKFDYLDKKSLDELTQYYFKKKLRINIPDILDIPTSEVIQLAFETKFYKNGSFEYFQLELNKKLNPN